MKLINTIAALLCISTAAAAQTSSHSYSFLLREVDQTWCGYSKEKAFQEMAERLTPLETARVTYKSGKPSEIVYEVQAESGDWIVVDTYSIRPSGMILSRTTVFAQDGIRIVQKGNIAKGRKNPLSLVSAKNPDGTKASLRGVVYPEVDIKNDLSQFPFLTIAASMQKKGSQMLCGHLHPR